MFIIKVTESEKKNFEFAKIIINRIKEFNFNYEVALVGGANRNAATKFYHNIDLPINDLDFTIFWKNEKGLVMSEFIEFVDFVKRMDDVSIVEDGVKFLHLRIIGQGEFKGFEVEFGTPRKEEYHDTRKPDVTVGTIKNDIQRRDFTINSLYTSIGCIKNINNEWFVELELHQMFKDTNSLFIKDIENKVLRTTSDNPEDVFNEDPLRLLRMWRFASDFSLTNEDN